MHERPQTVGGGLSGRPVGDLLGDRMGGSFDVRLRSNRGGRHAGAAEGRSGFRRVWWISWHLPVAWVRLLLGSGASRGSSSMRSVTHLPGYWRWDAGTESWQSPSTAPATPSR